jgi:hypothetical protein
VCAPNSLLPGSEKPQLNSLGFLTVLHESVGFVGGYLVTNPWGRPVEFRLTSAVQPNRVQQILYGGTLTSYVCADLIGKTLVDKAGVSVQMVITDREIMLDLRQKVEFPVLWLASAEDPRAASLAATGAAVRPATGSRGPLVCHQRFLADVAFARALLCRAEALDLAEPFSRIREAIGEARKQGLAGR